MPEAETASFEQEGKLLGCATFWIFKSVMYVEITLIMASVAIGLYYLDDCSVNRHIPVNLVFVGLFVLVYVLVMLLFFFKDQRKSYKVKVLTQLFIGGFLLYLGLNRLLDTAFEIMIPTSLMTLHCHPIILYFILGHFGLFFIAILASGVAIIIVAFFVFCCFKKITLGNIQKLFVVLYNCCFKKITLGEDPEAPGQ